MHRDFRLYLDDILSAISRVREYVHGLDRERFISDSKTVDAVIRNLEIIGEASRKLPDDIKAASAEVEWSKIIAMRNILTHEYFGVNNLLLWDIITNKLGTLESTCQRLLKAPDQ
ncbi:MAG: DUF86 domain-containing protein [Thermodesulfovibrionales bacterium]